MQSNKWTLDKVTTDGYTATKRSIIEMKRVKAEQNERFKNWTPSTIEYDIKDKTVKPKRSIYSYKARKKNKNTRVSGLQGEADVVTS